MAGDKKITELSEQTVLNTVTWWEVVDLTETDPNLQNKKVSEPTMGLHVQNTDQFLDEGGPNEVPASSVDIVCNRQQVYLWIYSDITAPTTNGFMRIVDVQPTLVSVQLNVTPIGMGGIQDYFESLPAGTHLQFSFNDGGGSILVSLNDNFSTTSGNMSAVSTIINDNRAALEGAYGVLTILPIVPVEIIPSPFQYSLESNSTPTDGQLYSDGFNALRIAKNSIGGYSNSALLLALSIGTYIYITGVNGYFAASVTGVGTDEGTYIELTVQQRGDGGALVFGDLSELTFITT
jgi:hypothetical protein